MFRWFFYDTRRRPPPARYLCIGGDSGKNGKTEAAMTGKLVTANVYARALSPDEVALLYAQYR